MAEVNLIVVEFASCNIFPFEILFAPPHKSYKIGSSAEDEARFIHSQFF